MTRIFFALMLSMAGTTASAHDIKAENTENMLYYVWTNNHTELAVSHFGNSYFDNSNAYVGDVVILEFVTYEGTTYIFKLSTS